MLETSRRRFALSIIATAVLWAAAAAQPAGAGEKTGALPPDCLAAGTISDAGILLQRAGDILSALSGRTAGPALRTDAGWLILNPDLAGVDLSAPVRFFCMNPKLFPRPWVWQFGVSDPAALKAAIASNDKNGESALVLEGRQATWSLNAKAAAGVLQWQKAGGKLPDFRSAGQLQARVDVQGFLRAFEAEFAAQLQAMKDRAREALERTGRSDVVQKEVPAIQSQLDSMAAALRQVRDVDFAVEMTPAFVRIGLDARLVENAPLRALFRAHAPGDLGLLGLCPADAGVVVVSNLSVMEAARRMFLNMIGLPSSGSPAPPADAKTAAGRRAVAFFFCSDGPESATHLEALDLRDGESAVGARQEWDRLSGPATSSDSEPFMLRRIPREEFELKTNATCRMAEVKPNEALLQPKGVGVFRRLLGERVLAAQEFLGEVCVTAVGRLAVQRVQKVEALAEAKKGSLLAAKGFRESMASLPEKPNLLLYVSPDALRRWFALSGIVSSEPIPADAMGLAAGLAIEGDGVRFALKLPVGSIPKAKPATP